MLVGLTGSIGSGKSTVARLLEERGAAVVDADRVAHEVIERPDVAAALGRAFGHDVVRADGSLDRRELGRRAFADAGSRERLNTIVRQPLEQAIWGAAERAGDTGAEIVVVDAPLIYEWGIEARFDVVVVVEAPAQARCQRAVARGLDSAEFAARAAAQLPPGEKARRADVVLDNSGDPAALGDLADGLMADLAVRR